MKNMSNYKLNYWIEAVSAAFDKAQVITVLTQTEKQELIEELEGLKR